MATAAFEEIAETFAFLDDWEDRYRHVIDLGRAMPPLDDSFKVPALKLEFKGASIMPCMHVLRGCQFHLPLWLNADVCKGPGGLEPSVTPREVFDCIHMGCTNVHCPWSKSLDHPFYRLDNLIPIPFSSPSKYTASHVAELKRERSTRTTFPAKWQSRFPYALPSRARHGASCSSCWTRRGGRARRSPCGQQWRECRRGTWTGCARRHGAAKSRFFSTWIRDRRLNGGDILEQEQGGVLHWRVFALTGCSACVGAALQAHNPCWPPLHATLL